MGPDTFGAGLWVDKVAALAIVQLWVGRRRRLSPSALQNSKISARNRVVAVEAATQSTTRQRHAILPVDIMSWTIVQTAISAMRNKSVK